MWVDIDNLDNYEIAPKFIKQIADATNANYDDLISSNQIIEN